MQYAERSKLSSYTALSVFSISLAIYARTRIFDRGRDQHVEMSLMKSKKGSFKGGGGGLQLLLDQNF